ncbi:MULTISPECIES: hypothetical protein [unclassified Pseudoxanthomonas]|jgi:hypothetical protein|nr:MULTISPECIES: hypothetical protein [unclassified Pseudoxanthomonas]MCH6483523.1 hypothetical protein [Pseudoxanthomonas sp. LH2527]
MPAAAARRSRHPVVLLFVGSLLVCDALVGRFLRRRAAPALLDSSR